MYDYGGIEGSGLGGVAPQHGPKKSEGPQGTPKEFKKSDDPIAVLRQQIGIMLQKKEAPKGGWDQFLQTHFERLSYFYGDDDPKTSKIKDFLNASQSKGSWNPKEAFSFLMELQYKKS